MNRFFMALMAMSVLFVTGCTIQYYEIKGSEVSNIEWSSADDGIYHGIYGKADEADSPLSFVCGVEITMQAGNLTNIDLIDSETSERVVCAGGITDSIIEAQSLEVDSVSGASISSNTIKLAVKNGVENALD